MKVLGRSGNNLEGVSLDWTASTLEFNVNGSGDITADVVYESVNASNGYNNLYFTVYVDGVRKNERLCLSGSSGNNIKTVLLAKNLSNGVHNIHLVRQTEAYFGTMTVKGIGFKGSLLSKPDDKTLIEFVGDSLTVGMGNLGTNGTHSQPITQYPVYQDGTQSYAYIAANNLNVDYRMIARTGIAAGYGYSDSETSNLLGCYAYQNAFVGDKTTYIPERSADIVCINLGTNDKWSGKCPSDEALTEKYIELVDLVKGYNNSVKSIVFVVGGINNNYLTAVQSAVAQLGGETANIYLCETSYNLTSGEQGHPSVAQHIRMGEELTKFFDEKNILQ